MENTSVKSPAWANKHHWNIVNNTKGMKIDFLRSSTTARKLSRPIVHSLLKCNGDQELTARVLGYSKYRGKVEEKK